MATTNKVKGWSGVFMTEDSSSHWPTKRRHVYYETSRRAGLEFVCVFGHDAFGSCRIDLVSTSAGDHRSCRRHESRIQRFRCVRPLCLHLSPRYVPVARGFDSANASTISDATKG